MGQMLPPLVIGGLDHAVQGLFGLPYGLAGVCWCYFGDFAWSCVVLDGEL